MADLFSCYPPEVQQTIFDILCENGSRKLLAPLLAVSKHWFALTSERLFEKVNLHTVWNLRDSPNADKYLSNVRCLTLGLGDQIYHPEIIQKWSQPPLYNLRKISFIPGAVFQGHDVGYIIPYFQPSVTTVELSGARWTTDLLSSLGDTCKSLKELSIKYSFKGKDFSVNAEEFESWIQKFPLLHSISVFYTNGNGHEKAARNAWTQLFSEATLPSLLQRPFRCLRLEHQLEDSGHLLNSATFHSLRELSMIVKLNDIANLSVLTDLQKLHILVQGKPKEDHRKVISPLCSMVGLKSLRVIFFEPYELYDSEIMSLRRLSKLEELEIFSSHQQVDAVNYGDNDDEDDPDGVYQTDGVHYTPLQILPSFDENDFDLLASSLSKLRRVCLFFDWKPNCSHVFRSIACSWPELEYLCLGYNLDLFASLLVSENGNPVFPYLKQLMKVRAFVLDLAPHIEAIRHKCDAFSQYNGKVYRNLNFALPRLGRLESRELSIHDQNGRHWKITISTDRTIGAALEKKEPPGWKWPRYSMNANWDFDHVV